MLSTGFSEGLATSGFARRASTQGDGSIVYRLPDGSGHVLVPRRDWCTLQSEFESAMGPIRKRTRWLLVSLFPGTFVFGMTIAQVLPFGGILILAAIFLGPLAIYLRHSRQVQRISAAIEAELAAYPRCASPERAVRREPRWFEIAFMILVGPHLLISLAGEIGGPDFFRGTPLWGSGIGPVETIAILCVVVRVAWPLLVARAARTS